MATYVRWGEKFYHQTNFMIVSKQLAEDYQNRLNWVVVIVRQSWRVFLNHSVLHCLLTFPTYGWQESLSDTRCEYLAAFCKSVESADSSRMCSKSALIAEAPASQKYNKLMCRWQIARRICATCNGVAETLTKRLSLYTSCHNTDFGRSRSNREH